MKMVCILAHVYCVLKILKPNKNFRIHCLGTMNIHCIFYRNAAIGCSDDLVMDQGVGQRQFLTQWSC